jgi:hypothetical protein
MNLQDWQTQVPLGLKLQQKTPSRKVLEPPSPISPTPTLTQLARQSLATPIGMFFYPLRQPTEIFPPNMSALNQ